MKYPILSDSRKNTEVDTNNNKIIMNKTFTFIMLIIFLCGCNSLKTKYYEKLYEKESKYKVKETGQSPFVGKWKWVRNKAGVRNLNIYIGERNDSLMFTIYAVLNYGNWVSSPSEDKNGKDIPEVCIANPKRSNTINAVFCKECSKYENPCFDSVTIKLMDKNTLVYSTAGGEYWGIPRQMVFKRVNNKNEEFSHRIYEVYKEYK